MVALCTTVSDALLQILCLTKLAAPRYGDECAKAAVAQTLGYPHVAALPPVLAPTVLQLPELCSILILKYNYLVMKCPRLSFHITYNSISHCCD